MKLTKIFMTIAALIGIILLALKTPFTMITLYFFIAIIVVNVIRIYEKKVRKY